MSRLDRQSFLGPNGNRILAEAMIGIVGLGGGGSHVAQQFAHMGVGGYVLADPDRIEDSNTNRLIGGTLADVRKKRTKVAIATRLIRGLQPDARINVFCKSWHDAAEALKACDLIVGAVDSFRQREQLERFARRYLIPYIDIGMDVHEIGKQGFLIGGQVILSFPGCPCLRCCGLITDERLEQEDNRYGVAGSRPQVVWPNGVLASTAVGIAAQALTAWYSRPPTFVCLEYDGNKGTVVRSARMDSLKQCICPHHPSDETGDPLFDIRKHLKAVDARRKAAASIWKRLAARLLRIIGVSS